MSDERLVFLLKSLLLLLLPFLLLRLSGLSLVLLHLQPALATCSCSSLVTGTSVCTTDRCCALPSDALVHGGINTRACDLMMTLFPFSDLTLRPTCLSHESKQKRLSTRAETKIRSGESTSHSYLSIWARKVEATYLPSPTHPPPSCSTPPCEGRFHSFCLCAGVRVFAWTLQRPRYVHYPSQVGATKNSSCVDRSWMCTVGVYNSTTFLKKSVVAAPSPSLRFLVTPSSLSTIPLFYSLLHFFGCATLSPGRCAV